MWKRELNFAVTAVVFLGFNLLNAQRGVKPTLATLGARLVVVIRSCWIFAEASILVYQIKLQPKATSHIGRGQRDCQAGSGAVVLHA